MTVIKIYSVIGDEREKERVPLLSETKREESDQTLRIFPFSPKLIYFTLNMALYSSLTFTSAYFFEQWGLPIYQFGALSALSIVELIGAVWWGGLADRTGQHRWILLMCTWMYCGCFCLLPVAEWILPDDNNLGLKLSISTVLLGGTYFFMSSFFPLIDSCVLKEIKKHDTLALINNTNNNNNNNNLPGSNGHVSFGKQRLWGTIGHAAISVISAQFISWFGWPGMFGVMILTCVTFSIIIYTIPDTEINEEFNANTNTNVNVNTNVNTNTNTNVNAIANVNVSIINQQNVSQLDGGTFKLLSRFDFLLFLFVILLSGYMRSILSIFLPYHLLIDLHQTPMFVGLTAVFRISAEILIFAYAQISDGLTTRTGEVKFILFGLAAGVLRVTGYGFLKEIENWSKLPLWLIVFLLETLKGISVACLISGAVRLAHDLVPETSSTRAQALVSGTYSGLSTGLAGIAGGTLTFLLPSHDLSKMFRFTAIGGTIGLIASLRLLKIIK